jgi:hypothetical protein
MRDEDSNQQRHTNWVIRNFGGFREGAVYHILTAIPSAILGGTFTTETFGSYLDVLTFPKYTDDFDGAILYCGDHPFTYALFHLRVYSEFCIHT